MSAIWKILGMLLVTASLLTAYSFVDYQIGYKGISLKKTKIKEFILGIPEEPYAKLLTGRDTIDNKVVQQEADTTSQRILLIGDSSCGKTSLLDATIREYYDKDYIPRDNVLYINNLQEQGISYYRTEVKTFCKTPSSISGKKKFIVLDDIDIINDQSQQVFRNCIDKYSHNVSFISSCTNTQKVVES